MNVSKERRTSSLVDLTTSPWDCHMRARVARWRASHLLVKARVGGRDWSSDNFDILYLNYLNKLIRVLIAKEVSTILPTYNRVMESPLMTLQVMSKMDLII